MCTSAMPDNVISGSVSRDDICLPIVGHAPPVHVGLPRGAHVAAVGVLDLY